MEKLKLDFSKMSVRQMMFLYYFTSHNTVVTQGSTIADYLGGGEKISAVNGLKALDPPVVYALGKASYRKPVHRIFSIWQFNHMDYDFEDLKERLPKHLKMLGEMGLVDKADLLLIDND